MPAGRGTSKRSKSTASKPRGDEPAKPPEPEGQVVPQEQMDGVVVRVVRSPQGGLNVAVSVLGDVRVTEVQTILALAQKQIREQLDV